MVRFEVPEFITGTLFTNSLLFTCFLLAPFTLDRQESVSTTADSEKACTAEEKRKIFKESRNDPANLVKATFKI